MKRTDEWTKNFNEDYFNRQFAEPYRSTVSFCNWLEELKVLKPDSRIRILDVGTGKGANLYYMSQRFKYINYVGIDINPDFVSEGNTILNRKGVYGNANLEVADIYHLDSKYVNNFEGIVSYQTLSWLPDYKDALKSLTSLQSDWIGITSLFYDGDVNCKIELEEYNKTIDNEPKRTFYNIYSLRLIERYFREQGFSEFSFRFFELDIDIPKPEHTIMGTYTEKLANGKRIQRSGPLLMNWYFILAKR